MHPRLEEIFSFLDEQVRYLRDTYHAVPVERRATAPAPGRWSADQVVHHVAMVNGRIAKMFTLAVAEAKAAGLAAETDASSIFDSMKPDKWRARDTKFVAPAPLHPHDTPAEPFALVEPSMQQVKQAALTGDGLALGAVARPHPALGSMHMYEWLGLAGAHASRHADQIREDYA
ncbi:MAG: DinB-like domain protein [Gemmatimonadetes bacterium]|nr:DinB-like domain protein [Gemmatimonadota bacterium]